MSDIDTLRDMIYASERIVFFGGAGVSTESGIPDFRSENGLFSAMRDYGYQPETLLSRGFFDRHPDIFFDYYRKSLCLTDIEPNPAHYALAKLEHDGRLIGIVTQNIDGLHQKAGSSKVYELHGSIYRNHCMRCGKAFGPEAILITDGVPKCECGGIIKPDVVLYEESLPDGAISGAVSAMRKADMLIVGGTSLAVYPAAGFLGYFDGARIAVINKSETSMDDQADIVIRQPIGQVLKEAIG